MTFGEEGKNERNTILCTYIVQGWDCRESVTLVKCVNGSLHYNVNMFTMRGSKSSEDPSK